MTPSENHDRREAPREGSFFSRLMQFWIEQKLLMGIVLACDNPRWVDRGPL